MSKKSSFDPNLAFKNIVGSTQDEIEASVPPEKKPQKEKLVQKAYYITEREYKALKLRAAMSDDKDMSALVREALDQYLSDTLETI